MIRMKCTSKKMAVAPYARVSVKEPDDQAAKQTADDEEELWDGLYIPTQERFFRNPPDGDTSQEQFILQDWLRQKGKNNKK